MGNTRMLTKVTGGTSFIRSYDGMTGAKTPPGQAKQSEHGNNGKAVGKGKDKAHSDNGKHLGQQTNADKANNGKAQGKASNGKGKNDNAAPVDGMPGSAL